MKCFRSTTFPLFALLLLCLAWLSGCAASSGALGRLDSTGFRSGKHAFAVAADPASHRLLGPDWTLDNTQPRTAGSPELISKRGPSWESTIGFDTNGDGVVDGKEKVRDAELVFRHARSDASIWLSVYPIPQRRERTELDVLAREYVEGVSGTDSLSKVRVETGAAWVSASEKRYATRVLESVPMVVSGSPAIKVTFEVANVDQLQLSAEARWTRATLVMVRPGWWWAHGEQAWPALLVAGYQNRPDHFADSEADFAAFVQRLQIYRDVALLDAQGPQVLACYKGGRGPLLDSALVLAEVSPEGTVERTTVYARGAFEKYGCTKRRLHGIQLVATGSKRTVISLARRVYEPPPIATAPAVPTAPEAAPAPTVSDPWEEPASTAPAEQPGEAQAPDATPEP